MSECPNCGAAPGDASFSTAPGQAVCPTDGCPVNSWDSENEPAELPIDARGRAAGVLCGTVGLVAGQWIGIASVPDAALLVPEVLPAPRSAVGFTLFVIVLGAYVAWDQWQRAEQLEDGGRDE